MRMMFRTPLPAAALAIAIPPVSAAKPVYGAWGFDATGMDRAVKPRDDFCLTPMARGTRRPTSPPTAAAQA